MLLSVRFRSKKLEIRIGGIVPSPAVNFRSWDINSILSTQVLKLFQKTLVVSAYDVVDDKGWPHHECIISVKPPAIVNLSTR